MHYNVMIWFNSGQYLLALKVRSRYYQLSNPFDEFSFSFEENSWVVACMFTRFLLIAERRDFVDVFSWLLVYGSFSTVGLGGRASLVLRM